MTGQERTSFCQKCSDERKQSDSQKHGAEIKGKIAKHISQSGIPKRFEKSRLGNYRAVCQEANHVLSAVTLYTSDFKTCLGNGTSLVLCGRVGTGKTHVACGIANDILRQGFTAKYTTSYKAINAVKATYRNTDQTEAQVIAEFQRPDLLILDEVGIQFGTDAEKIIMYQIINSRYDEVKPIIIISNLDEEGLLKYIGEPCHTDQKTKLRGDRTGNVKTE
jgi:DNA replication protein DnaC